MSAQPRVYLCDDDEGVRAALTFLLRQCEMQVSAYASGPELLAVIDTTAKPVRGVFVLDVRMEPMTGPQLHEQLRARGLGRRNPVLFLSGHGDVDIAVGELKKGALDFVRKPYTDGALVDLIRAALSGEVGMQARADRCDELTSLLISLSRQQHRIMPLVAAGDPIKVIARKLDLSGRAIEVHKAKLLEKLGVSTGEQVATLLEQMRECGLDIDSVVPEQSDPTLLS